MVTLLLPLLVAPVAAASGYTMGEGDTITVHVFGEDSLSREYRIDDRCTISVGLIGTVEVCGRSTGQVSQEIGERLADGYLVDPHVSVDVSEYGSKTVLITGEVKNQMRLSLDGPTTVIEAIVQAGGPKESNVGEVKVASVDGDVTTYDYLALASGSPVYLSPGDTVMLSEGQFVWVSGEVKDEGPVTYRQGLTVTQALASSGGPNEFARVRRAYIVRPDGEKVAVNLARILGGRDADLMLGPDDKLVVP